MSKEQVYDERIAPLMEQIIAICKEHKIAVLANFSTPNSQDEHLVCTTALLASDFDPKEEQLLAYRILCSRMPAAEIKTQDANGSITESCVVLG